VKVLVDSREPDFLKTQAYLEFDDCEEKELGVGDFEAPELGLCIERKEASDFASSLKEGRLGDQADRMAEGFEHRYVIVEGDLFDLAYTDLSHRSLVGMQTSLAVKRGIRLLNTPGVEHTLYAVRRVAERIESGESPHRVKTYDVDSDDPQVRMLAQIEGVSVAKAERILDEIKFDAVVSLAGNDANVLGDALAQVDGVGPTLADRIINAFAEE
jgi:ERCC4-type nuclease